MDAINAFLESTAKEKAKEIGELMRIAREQQKEVNSLIGKLKTFNHANATEYFNN